MTSVAPHHTDRSDRSYCFIVDNLPETYGWKELKDLVQAIATVGYVTVPLRISGQPRRKGWFEVKQRHDPIKLFHILSKKPVEGHLLSIHYFECVGEGAVFVDCNCRELSNDCHQSSHRMQSAPSSASWSTSSSSATPSPTTDHFPLAMQPVYRPPTYAPQPAARAAHPASYPSSRTAYEHRYPPNVAPAPVARPDQSYAIYAMGHNGIPVNTVHGVVTTRLTGIHINGLNWQTSQKSLNRFLADMGCQPISCTLKRDSEGRSKGTALANYGSPALAQQAIARLNGRVLDERALKVKSDVNGSEVVGSAGGQAHGTRYSHGVGSSKPMVMDGSTERRDPNS